MAPIVIIDLEFKAYLLLEQKVDVSLKKKSEYLDSGAGGV